MKERSFNLAVLDIYENQVVLTCHPEQKKILHTPVEFKHFCDQRR